MTAKARAKEVLRKAGAKNISLKFRRMRPGELTLGDNFSRRFAFTEEEIVERAENLLAVGQINPVGIYVDGDTLRVEHGNLTTLAALWIEKNTKEEVFELNVNVVEGNPGMLRDRNYSENAVRRDLSPMDHGQALAQYARLGWSQAQIRGHLARLSIQRSASWISNHLKLDKSLVEPLAELVHRGKVTMSLGLELCDLSHADQHRWVDTFEGKTDSDDSEGDAARVRELEPEPEPEPSLPGLDAVTATGATAATSAPSTTKKGKRVTASRRRALAEELRDDENTRSWAALVDVLEGGTAVRAAYRSIPELVRKAIEKHAGRPTLRDNPNKEQT